MQCASLCPCPLIHAVAVSQGCNVPGLHRTEWRLSPGGGYSLCESQSVIVQSKYIVSCHGVRFPAPLMSRGPADGVRVWSVVFGRLVCCPSVLFIFITSEPGRAELTMQVRTCPLPVPSDSKEVGNVEDSNTVLDSFSNLENS